MDTIAGLGMATRRWRFRSENEKGEIMASVSPLSEHKLTSNDDLSGEQVSKCNFFGRG
jgi:hypothetical protein